MKPLLLHHLNLTSMDPSRMWEFYVNKLGLSDDPTHWTPGSGDFDDNRFFKAGDIEFHLSRVDPGLSTRFGRSLNPLLTGHIAFLVDDIDELRARLREQDVPYADYGTDLGGHWAQVFVADPSGRIVEFREYVPDGD
jgi:catechol 2,3-dioxygenase-like lactoylglutathione lyase family enzyme